jgi:hypothetical protein
MRREGFPERVGEQEEEADPQEESHLSAVFAAPTAPSAEASCVTSGTSSRVGSATRSGSLRGGLSWSCSSS